MTTDLDERLARLQQRRPKKLPPPSPGERLSTAPISERTDISTTVRDVASTPRKKRRSPAQASKIVAAGASAAAVLGLLAVLGATSSNGDSAVPTPPVLAQPAPITPSPPQVVVVVLESNAASGIGPSSLATVEMDNAAALASEIAQQIVAVTPLPVAAPNTIDLAVPAPAQPVTPAPQAASGGS